MYHYEDIKTLVDKETVFIGDLSNIEFDKAKNLNDADEYSIVWVKNSGQDAYDKISQTKARVIICKNNIDLDKKILDRKCCVLTSNPKYIFTKIVNHLFVPKWETGIHQTAIIDKEAKFGKNVYIGPYSVIEKCILGDNCYIDSHCHIYNNVIIGNNVQIGSSTIIGGFGFGYSRDENEKLHRFPHIGGVVIGDDVEIGSNTSIDCGSLSDTIIKNGVKIDNLVHIAHNVIIEKDSLIIAHSILCGSCKIGERTWIAPSVCVRNNVVIGNDVVVGMGAIVTKNIPDNESWIGNPAKPLSEYLLSKGEGK
ncbi:MAG TPA: UDP-3-O-(3-hydroxymyristoyl)glucosamine N-acyltransferase [Bacilli bacterium]|nr:UDP-3-O-(3-hydroxymyristoyl)glucosamine N-acyltransferase [Bacilli bacterium]